MEKIKIRQATKQGYIECDIGGVFDMRYPNSKTRCGRVKGGGQICPTLLTSSQIVRINMKTIIPQTRGGQCPALTASYDKVGLDNLIGVDHFPKPCCLTNENERYRIRKLTPTECFRLMGCNEKTCKKLTESNISNSQLYKMAGNSIVVDCLFHIFRQAFTTDRDEVLQPTLF